MNIFGFGVSIEGDCEWAVGTAAVVFGIGLFHIAKCLFSLSRFAFRFLLPPINFKRFGSWVVVTGATDGIGKAYCEEFAKRGLNVCLLSRTESRLVNVSDEIKNRYRVETRHLAVDFAKMTDEHWKRVSELLEDLEVGILVNNVGCSYEYYEYLDRISEETIQNLIEINIRTTVQMTRLALPQMLKRKKGVVLNVGSGVGVLLPSSPLLAVYAGSKAFVDQFTKSCAIEYKEKGILFQNQAPLFVATKMSKIRRPSLTAPSPKAWAKGALQQVGNGSLTSGYWIHNIMWAVLSAFPKSLLDAYFFSAAKKIRAKALKKKEAAAKKE